jgi:hypothetical protein
LRIEALWPNPGQGALVAQIDAPRAMRVGFDILAVDGRLVRRLPGVELAPGGNRTRVAGLSAGPGLPGGIYFLCIREGRRIHAVRRFVLTP